MIKELLITGQVIYIGPYICPDKYPIKLEKCNYSIDGEKHLPHNDKNNWPEKSSIVTSQSTIAPPNAKVIYSGITIRSSF